MSPQSAGNVLYSLGKLGINYDMLTDRLKMSLEISIRRVINRKDNNANILIKMQDLTQVLQGMSMIQFKYQYLSPSTSLLLAEAIYQHAIIWRSEFKKINADATKESENKLATMVADVATCFYTISHLGLSWTTLPSPVKAGLFLGLKVLSGYQEVDDNMKENAKADEKRNYGAASKRVNVYSSPKSKDLVNNAVLLQAIETFFNVSNELTPSNTSAGSRSDVMDTLILEDTNSYQIPLPRSKLVKESLSWSLSNIMYSFVKLNATIDEIPSDIRRYIWKCTELYSSGSSLQSLALILFSMGKLGVDWKEDDSIYFDKVKPVLSYEFKRILSNYDREGGHIYTSSHNKERPPSIGDISHDLTHTSDIQSISNILYGFSLMKISWSDLSVDMKQSITSRITKEAPYLLELEQMYSLLHALAEMKAVTMDFALQQKLFERFVELFHSYYRSADRYISKSYAETYRYDQFSKYIALSLRCFGLMSFRSLLNDNTKDYDSFRKLALLIENVQNDLSVQGLCIIWKAFASSLPSTVSSQPTSGTYQKMDKYIHQNIYPSLLRTTIKLCDHYDARSLSSILSSIGRLHLFSSSSSSLQSSHQAFPYMIIKNLHKIASDGKSLQLMNDKDVVFLIRGLSSLRNFLPWRSLSSSIRIMILRAIDTYLTSMTVAGVVSCLQSMSNWQMDMSMETDDSTFSTDEWQLIQHLRSNIAHAIKETIIPYANPLECSSVVISLHSMHFPRDHLSMQSLWHKITDHEDESYRHQSPGHNLDRFTGDCEIDSSQSYWNDISYINMIEKVTSPHDKGTDDSIQNYSNAFLENNIEGHSEVSNSMSRPHFMNGYLTGIAMIQTLSMTSTSFESLPNEIQQNIIFALNKQLSTFLCNQSNRGALSTKKFLGLLHKLSSVSFPSYDSWPSPFRETFIQVAEYLSQCNNVTNGEESDLKNMLSMFGISSK